MDPQFWNEVHPVVVHFPIALLLIAPVFVLFGTLLPGTRGRTFLSAALVLMSMGTVGTLLARLTGSVAATGSIPGMNARHVLADHSEMAEITIILFSVLTISFGVTLWTIWYRRLKRALVLQRVLPLLFLIFYGAGILQLLRTASLGVRLTHEFGVHLHAQPRAKVAFAQGETGSVEN
jgi:uncharacterized membrane protein